MNIHRVLTTLIVAPILTLSQPSLAQNSQPNLNEKLSLYAKPAVVRIVNRCRGVYKWYPNGTSKEQEADIKIDVSFIGTGFFINPNGYIVTSARAVQSQEECKKNIIRNIRRKINEDYGYILDKAINDSYITGNKNGKFTFDFDPGVVILPKATTEPLHFEVKSKSTELSESESIELYQSRSVSRDVAIIKISTKDAPTVKLSEDYNQVRIQDHIIVVGYPTTADIDLKESLTAQSYVEASVQEGRISNPNKQIEGGYPVLLVDTQAGKGNAGSPLLNDQGEVIGMLASNEYTKDASVPLAIPASTIWEFIRQSGATNQRGQTDQYYSAGLDLFWQGNNKEARAKFERVRDLFPSHSEVDELFSIINQREAEIDSNPWKNPTYLFLLALVAGGGIVAAIAYFLLRRKSSAKKASPVFPGVSAQGSSVLKTSQGNGVSAQTLELEYQGQIRRSQLNKDEHYLGRDPQWSDFNIPTSWEAISRKHAILRKEGEDYRIYDGDGIVPSRNGLWIDNLTRVDHQYGYLLQNGDQLKIGKDPHEQITLTYFNPNSSQAQVKPTSMA